MGIVFKNEKVFHMKSQNYFEEWDKEFKDNFLQSINLSERELEDKDFNYVEIRLDNVNKKALITFKNSSFESIASTIEDDWYVIMDCIFNDKWLGKYDMC